MAEMGSQLSIAFRLTKIIKIFKLSEIRAHWLFQIILGIARSQLSIAFRLTKVIKIFKLSEIRAHWLFQIILGIAQYHLDIQGREPDCDMTSTLLQPHYPKDACDSCR